MEKVLLLLLVTPLLSYFDPSAKADSPPSLIGVCYGMQGDNLPAATDVINLYKRYNIANMRLFDNDPAVLQALRGSGIFATLCIRNQDLPNLASDAAAVASWFATNVEPYLNDVQFTYITVGNEVVPSNLGQYVLPVMKSLQAILDQNHLAAIKVTTVIPTSVLASSYPPSAGRFTDEALNDLRGILGFLSAQGSPIMINVYPYFAYAADPVNIRLDYAQFTATSPVVQDGSLSYYNLFDAIVDAVIWAMEREGVTDVSVAVSESGWPSAGNGNYTNPDLASTYNKNFVNHISTNAGTPKRPKAFIEGFIFAMFNEDQKSAGIEQNFGLFYPNMNPVYNVF